MASQTTSDIWVPACDLCGSLNHATLAQNEAAVVRRCRECGLVSITHAGDASAASHLTPRLPVSVQVEAIRELRDRFPRSILIIGEPAPEVVAAANDVGATVTALQPYGTPVAPGVIARMISLESAAFAPDSFTLMICTDGLDNAANPSLVMDRAGRWLDSDGTLLVGALNAEPLIARLGRRRWLEQPGPGTRYLFTQRVLNEYARRFGFTVDSIRNRSHTRDVASIVTGANEPSWFSEMMVAPVALVSSLLGKGVVLVVRMRRGGLVLRPLVRPAEEALEDAPGFAPALYAGAHERAAESA